MRGLLMTENNASRSYRFMGLDLVVPPDVLKPRPETELLARNAIEHLNHHVSSREPWVIDMCCGSGNLAVSIAVQVASCRLWASDLTEAAIAAAIKNVERHQLSSRLEVMTGDLFEAFAGRGFEGKVDLVVCNPPYISSSRLDGPSAGLLSQEPREAFDGGPFGLSIHQRVIREAAGFLAPGGILMCEFGEGQERQVAALFQRTKAYQPVEFVCDAAGVPRVAVGRRNDGVQTPAKGLP
jgi:release factor glutamine methyltransferase